MVDRITHLPAPEQEERRRASWLWVTRCMSHYVALSHCVGLLVATTIVFTTLLSIDKDLLRGS